MPGEALKTWNLKHVPVDNFKCCKLDVVKGATGLKIKNGTQYWVVASTNKSEEKTRDGWFHTWNLSTGKAAINQGKGWAESNNALLTAFGVFGKKTE